ncbi:hypothetical protein [Phyllobacterium sp. SB3]|uniref:hypothetical protein n=1 Tax=Phyllobacterium sp. SB3 TaxID=3156073 RepID=UPI0032AE9364
MSDIGNKPLGSDWTALLPKQMIPVVNLLGPQLEVAAAVSVASTEIATRMFGIWTNAMLGSFDLKTATTQSEAKADAPVDIAALKTVIREKARADTKPPVAQPVVKSAAAGLTDSISPKVTDDLKKISGVGPKLEQVLNAMGVRSYAQIAAWSAADAAKIDEQLKLNGRISRDDWIGQVNRLVSEVK